MNRKELKSFLDKWADEYNRPGFILHDPISIPHQYSKLQDIEIAGFFAAIMAWGNRKTIINKCSDLMNRMDRAPHDFILHATPNDLRKLEGFVHRTLNDTDVIYLVSFLKLWYQQNESLETAFARSLDRNVATVEQGLIDFHDRVFDLPHVSERTRKHIATPRKNSACKRLNMYLRWMVRSDDRGVDFGIWKSISPSQLICPLDVHVQRIATQLGLVDRSASDWKTAVHLTAELRSFDPEDPVRYDYALFGLGIEGFGQ